MNGVEERQRRMVAKEKLVPINVDTPIRSDRIGEIQTKSETSSGFER